MVLKRATPLNIVIGGAAGALPPVIGWARATGNLARRADRAFPVHLPLDAAAFLGARALPRRRLRARRRADAAECRRSGRDLPADRRLFGAAGRLVVRSAAHPGRRAASTRRSRRSCGAIFLWRAFALYRLREAEEAPRRKAAMALFGYSILYMFLLFAALLAQSAAEPLGSARSAPLVQRPGRAASPNEIRPHEKRRHARRSDLRRAAATTGSSLLSPRWSSSALYAAIIFRALSTAAP